MTAIYCLPSTLKQTVFQNVYENFNEKTGAVVYRKDIREQKVDQWLSSCPGPQGGHDWQATSYHQPSDTLDTLNLDFLAGVSDIVVGCIEDLAGVH